MNAEFRRFVQKLHRNGYVKSRVKGSHFIFVRESDGDSISINKIPNKMVIKRLTKEHRLK